MTIAERRKGKAATSARWRAAHPEESRDRVRRAQRKCRYGLTHADWLRRLEEQGGLCAVFTCLRPAACVDHCHKTNKVRGLLCKKHNTGFGLLGDSYIEVSMAAEYLRIAEGGECV